MLTALIIDASKIHGQSLEMIIPFWEKYFSNRGALLYSKGG